MIEFKNYSVKINEDAFEIYSSGEQWFTLPVRSAVDARGAVDRDDLTYLKKEEVALNDGCRVIWHCRSSLYEYKDYVVDFTPSGFHYRIELQRIGDPVRLEKIRFFNHGDGVSYEAAGYFQPLMDLMSRGDYTHNLKMIMEPGEIKLCYLAPPEYMYPFYMNGCSGWFGLGLTAEPGRYNFDRFQYHPHKNHFHLELPLFGKTEVRSGEKWTSFGILGLPGSDAFDILRKYSEWHFSAGGCKRRDYSNIPEWWKGPIFCGWGEQGDKARMLGLPSTFHAATQKIYTEMSDQLDQWGLAPSFMIIDDKWQKTYGGLTPDPEKWQNMRAFTDREHAKGRRVLLWVKMWTPEGLPSNACVHRNGCECSVDPTSPEYQKHLRKTIHTLLSSEEGCCNCDGFKLDFIGCVPDGESLTTAEKNVYGVELLKRLASEFYYGAKEAKPDALINASYGHPYFAEVCDQARLHDYIEDMRNAVEMMEFRKTLFDCAMPGISIDTDAGGTGSRRDFLRYITNQPKLGAPDLYYLTRLTKEPFGQDVIDRIRSVWNEYKAR